MKQDKAAALPSGQGTHHQELNGPVNPLSHRVARCLEKRGLLERDAENSWLTLEESEDDVLTQLHGHPSLIASPPDLSRVVKCLTLQTIPGGERRSQTMAKRRK